MLLETRRLCKSFGSLKAADGIDLGVAAGEAVGIIGPERGRASRPCSI
jgi:ABC-type branched-subunit amino acid transport system ATPase component